MKKKRIICVVGKTCRGKDTLAKRINKEMKIPMVCSYTTRGMRDDDIEGISHYFVTDERMEEILKTEHILAHVKKKSGVQYCATLESIQSDEVIYIIDPAGVQYLKDNFKDQVELIVVELWAKDKDIENRVIERGDDWQTYTQRIEDEKEEFDGFHERAEWDISISAMMDRDSVFNMFKAYYESITNGI